MNKLIKICFPESREYLLKPVDNIIKKNGYYFPSEIEDKTLFVTGVSGTGKTTFVKKFCDKAGWEYREDQAIVILNEDLSLFKRFYYPTYKEFNSLCELKGMKLIDGHFMFDFFHSGERKYFFAHSNKNFNRINFQFDLNFHLPLDVKKDFVFEFRQFSPLLIEKIRKERAKKEYSGKFPKKGVKHYAIKQSPSQILESLNLTYRIAYFLHNQGADVYIRENFNAKPLKFVE